MKILGNSQSVCPICKKVLDAFYVSEKENVYLFKKCEEHGEFQSLIAEKQEDFTRWVSNQVVNIPPKESLTKGTRDSQCPLHCGPCENHLQTACCVLIDITERCNQHCPYCFAKAETDEGSDLDFAEIEKKLDLLLELGEERPYNLQLSGGEPTVRNDLPEIIRMAKEKGFPYIQINTNGRRISLEEGYAKKLKQAGASVIFMQFDGTNDEIYQALRGEPLLEIKKRAIENCRKAGIPVTLVPTIVKNVNLENIGSLVDFLLENVDIVKGLHFQPVSFFGRHPDQLPRDGNRTVDFENRVTLFNIMHQLELQTQGRLKYTDFYPINAGHTLCSFSSTYQKMGDGQVKSLINYETKESKKGCCTPANSISVIKKDRDFVLNKWELMDLDSNCSCTEMSKGKSCCETEEMDFDSFLMQAKGNMFSVSSMAFQDESNLDAERLKRCRVQVLSPDNRLIPFCAYNSIYRE